MLLLPAQRVGMAEDQPIPYLTLADLNFGGDYGEVTFTASDLASVKRVFDEKVRGDSLPIIDEDHDPSRAAGWITKLDFDPQDATRLLAWPRWNEGSDALTSDGSYRFTSPTLLRDWCDPKTGTTYDWAPAGLKLNGKNDTSGMALTNFPRIRDLGPITCSEGAVAVRFADATAQGEAGPGEVMASLMTYCAPDGDEYPPCQWAPPFSSYSRCPGFTRILVDGDGDGPGDIAGCCKLAPMCNGYSPITPGQTPSVSYYSEEEHTTMAGTPTRAGQPATAETPPTEPTPTPTPAPAPAPAPPTPSAAGQADFAETQRILAAERNQRERLQTQVTELSERLARKEADEKIASVTARLQRCVDQGRLTPAEFSEKTSQPARLMLFAENAWLIEDIEKRTPVVRLGEPRGSGEEPTAGDVSTQALMRAAEDHIKANGLDASKPADFLSAARAAARSVSGGR